MIRALIVLALLLIWFGALLLGSQLLFLALFCVLTIGICYELARLLFCKWPKQFLLFAFFNLSLLSVGLAVFDEFMIHVSLVFFILTMTMIIVVDDKSQDVPASVDFFGKYSLSIFVVLCWLSIYQLVKLNNGMELLIYFSSCIWFRDIASNLGGRLSSKLIIPHVISQKINPSKSWEGAIWGIILTALFAIFMSPYLSFHFSLYTSVGVGLLCGLGGQLGDLFGSALKRYANVRDSSRVFTRHQGGVIDGFDGFILTIPLLNVLLLHI